MVTMNIEECEKLFTKAIKSNSKAEFYNSIAPLFNEYEILSITLGRGSIFWRARIINNDIYPNADDLDYPPPVIASANRLNDKGSPFFYISTDIETALAEVGPVDGQLVQLAGFKVKNESPLNVAVIGEYSNVQKCGYMHFVGKDPDGTISRILNELPRKEAIKRIYIDRFFAHVLRDENAHSNNYRYSRALSQAILSKNHAHGIVFPSVKDRGGFNLGIRAEPSDACFDNVSCVIAKVNAIREFGLIDYEIINSATHLNKDGAFVWPKKYIPECLGIYNMSKDELDAALQNQSRKIYYKGKIKD
jgi:hypothetical protein